MIDLQYVAGFFDGEGCVYISPEGRPCVSVTQKRSDILRLFREDFGGKVVDHTGKCSRWQILSREEIINFLEVILPYSIVKTDEIKLGIKAAMLINSQNKGCNPHSESEWAERYKIRAEMQKLRPSRRMVNLQSVRKKHRDSVKEKCKFKCQLCGKSMKDLPISGYIITKDDLLICRACNFTRFDQSKKIITKEEIVNAMDGRSVEEAAKMLGLVRSSLYKKRMKLGMVKIKPNKISLTKEQLLSVSKEKAKDQAKILGISRRTLCVHRKKFGLRKTVLAV